MGDKRVQEQLVKFLETDVEDIDEKKIEDLIELGERRINTPHYFYLIFRIGSNGRVKLPGIYTERQHAIDEITKLSTVHEVGEVNFSLVRLTFYDDDNRKEVPAIKIYSGSGKNGMPFNFDGEDS